MVSIYLVGNIFLSGFGRAHKSHKCIENNCVPKTENQKPKHTPMNIIIAKSGPTTKSIIYWVVSAKQQSPTA